MGTWRNIEDIENNLTMEELELIVKATREREYRMMKFHALLKGVDLDKDNEDGETGQDVIDRAKRKADMILSGATQEEIEKEEEKAQFADFGIDIEVE